MSTTDFPTICFPVRYPDSHDLRDGFYRRVQAIDDLLSDEFERVYIRTDGSVKQVRSQWRTIKPGCHELRISRRYPWQVKEAMDYVHGKTSYCHSILSMENEVAQRIFESSGRLILDLHGAVPEEAVMMGESEERVLSLSQIERQIVTRAELVIGVSENLVSHITSKYGIGNRLVIPISNGLNHLVTGERDHDLIVYSGGIQAWQQVDKMLSFVNRHPERRFIFLTRGHEWVKDRYRELYELEFPGEAFGVDPDDLGKWYEKAEFGLILREDSVVNRVASPTKLTEYLAWGMIPILDSDEIGDFKKLGFKGMPYDEAIWSPEECEAARKQNAQVLDEIQRRFKIGGEDLKKVLQKTGSD